MTKLYVLNFRATGMGTTGELSYSPRRGFKVVKIGDGTLFALNWNKMTTFVLQSTKIWPDICAETDGIWRPRVTFYEKTLDIYPEEKESE